jgi:hypothetical protein
MISPLSRENQDTEFKYLKGSINKGGKKLLDEYAHTFLSQRK